MDNKVAAGAMPRNWPLVAGMMEPCALVTVDDLNRCPR